MQHVEQKRLVSQGASSKEFSWGVWARLTAFDASSGIGKRIIAWIVLAGYAAFVFGFPVLIWCTWKEWDFCRIAHIYSLGMPVYWIYLAVNAKQRRDEGLPLMRLSDHEKTSTFEGWRIWRVRLYERSVAEKIGDVAIRLIVFGVIALIFRTRITDNGYFWFLLVELVFRVGLMIKRPSSFDDSAAGCPTSRF